jgi:hypothetical protein
VDYLFNILVGKIHIHPIVSVGNVRKVTTRIDGNSADEENVSENLWITAVRENCEVCIKE